MGFGKFLLGSICAVGAVIAAPVVLPAAGLAAAGGSVAATLGGVGLAAAAGTTAVTGTTLVTGGLVLAGAGGGVAAAAYVSEKIDDARYEGQKSGYIKASNEYAEKLAKQVEEFTTERKNWKQNKAEYNTLIDDMMDYIKELTQELNKDPHNPNTVNDLNYTNEQLNRLKRLRAVC